MEEQQNQNQNQQFDFEDEQIAIKNSLSHTDHGWQKVVYPKRQRKSKSDSGSNQINNNGGNQKSNVFSSVEEHAEERRKKDAQRKAAIADAEFEDRVVTRIKHHDEYDEDDDEYDSENGGGKIEEVKKVKEKKKVKKIKVTVAEAANKIDAADLAAFLIDATASYEAQENIQLMRFADYFARAFSAVKNAEFPWTKMFKESTVGKMADVPLNDVPEEVYKTSTDWINKRSSEAVGTFILWSLDTIFADLASHQVPTKGSKKVVHQGTSKAQVALFVALAMVLRKKPDVLISLLPKLREEAKYQGQDKLPVMLWVAAQASQGDLVVGMYAWVQNLFPVVSGKSCNTQSRDLVLQLLERFLAAPKARSILLNGAVRKGERLVPPSAFDLLMRATFPPTSSRIKATERFEAAYPTLKELALAGTPGSKAMKQVTQQIFTSALKAAGEGIPDLTSESASVAIWCLTQNPDCYKLWDTLYLDNVEASATVLKKLSDEWKVHSAKHATLDPVRVAIQSFRQKNESAIAKGGDTGSFRTADKYAKNLLGRVSRGNGCVKSLLVVGVAISAAYIYMSPDLQGQLDWNKLSAMFTPTGSS